MRAVCWSFSTEKGPTAVRAGGRLVADSGDLVREWAMDGHGLAFRSVWDVADDIGAGLQRPAVTEREHDPLAVAAALPHGPDRVDHPRRRQPVAARDLGVADVAATQGPALRLVVLLHYLVSSASVIGSALFATSQEILLQLIPSTRVIDRDRAQRSRSLTRAAMTTRWFVCSVHVQIRSGLPPQ